MKKIMLIIYLIIPISLFAAHFTIYEDIKIQLPEKSKIKSKSNVIMEISNNTFKRLLNFKSEITLNLPDGVELIIGISDNAKTSKQMNSLSTLNWLTVVSAYTNMINKNVKKKREQGYKTVSTLTGDWIGNYRAIISRLGWATEKGLNNLFIADVFHEKAILSIKVTWVSDDSDSEKIADQVISSISTNKYNKL